MDDRVKMPEYLLTWTEFAEIAALGMECDHVVVDDGIPEIHGNATEAAMAELEKRKKKKPGMTATLSNLFTRATQNQGKPQRIENLGGGLGIDLIVGLDGVVRMQIYRSRTEPGQNEWDTVIKYFPFPALAQNVKRFSTKGKFYIQAELLLQEK
jgi:hypothetical protein